MRTDDAAEGIRRQLDRSLEEGELPLNVDIEVPPELDFSAAQTHAERYVRSLGFHVSERWRYFDFTNGRTVGFRLSRLR